MQERDKKRKMEEMKRESKINNMKYQKIVSRLRKEICEVTKER